MAGNPLNPEPLPEQRMLQHDYQGHNLVFIVGCPRSGTTWLQSLVASHPQVHTGRESHIFHWYLGPLLRNWNREAENRETGLGNYLREEEFWSILQNFMFQLFAPMVLQLKDGELFLEKTPDHGLFMREISEMLPRSKFLHMLRDGRDVTASLLAASKGWGKSWAPRNCRSAANTWVRSVEAVRESSKSLPEDRFLEVRYEAMWSDAEKTLSGVAKFLGLSWDDQDIREAVRRNDFYASPEGRTPIRRGGAFSERAGPKVMNSDFLRKGVPGSWKEDLSWADKVQFWLVARKTMKEMGYSCRYP